MKLWASTEAGKGCPPWTQWSGGPGIQNHRASGCAGRGMIGKMLTESQGRREGLRPVCTEGLRALGLSLYPCEMGLAGAP